MTDPENTPAAPPSPEPGHIPVLLTQVLEYLAPKPGMVVLDCTLGRGGHAKAIIPLIGPGGTYIGLDLDAGNLAYAKLVCQPIADAHRVALHTYHQSFALADQALALAEAGKADALLADLGFASNQVDDPARGLSFRSDGPLDMRLDPEGPTTAADLVNSLPERELADLIYQLGEERFSRRIARKIIARRAEGPILTTSALAEVCRQSYGPQGRSSRIDPATRTFQALRIAVNGELDALNLLLKRLPVLLADDGRAGIISFHSLEDRPVKRALLAAEQADQMKRITRKPVIADLTEQNQNPRSRSAKLRVAQRVGTEHSGEQ